jgi:pimeloyl-ACP methyl ester carboxylesterase
VPRAGKLRRNLGLAAVSLLAAWLLSSAIVTWRLTHRSQPPFPEPIPVWGGPIPAWGAASIEEVRIDTRDGERLGAWFVPAPEASVAVLVLHGNGGSRQNEADLMRWFSGERATVLAPSLRAHGDSTGATNDLGWSARADVIACVAFLERRAPGSRIVVFGDSLGAAAAIYAAGELGHRVQGYVLEAPYRDVRAATRHRLAMYLPPVLDRLAYAGLLLWSRVMLSPSPDELRPIDRAADIPNDVPVVFLSGTEDRHAPLAEVEEIRSRCGNHAKLIVFPGAAHDALVSTDPSRYARVLREALAAAKGP